MALDIITRVVDDIVILDLAGRLWVRESPLQKHVHDLLAQGHRFFVLNISKVDYMDSSGLGQLISLWTSTRSRNGNVNLVGPTEKVRQLLTMTQLHIVFDVFNDEERARIAVHRGWPA